MVEATNGPVRARIQRTITYLDEWDRRAAIGGVADSEAIKRMEEWAVAILQGVESNIEGGEMGKGPKPAVSVWPKERCLCGICPNPRLLGSAYCEACEGHHATH
jgi:hypothetical protein